MKVRFFITVTVVAIIAIPITIWNKFYRELPQPEWIHATQRSAFLYGAVDARDTQGIPYWIWLALPRMFPEHMPGAGGYASLGLSWEETLEMPVGFAKQTVGYTRVTGNCALCHVTSRPDGPGGILVPVVVVRGHTRNIQQLVTFLKECAEDSRFNASEILAEVDNATKLSFSDRMLYRYVLIPRTKEALKDPQGVIFAQALEAHTKNPKIGFSDQRMKELEAWLSAQGE